MRVAITVDVEQDCPPFRETFRGITEGMPKLLGLFKEKDIKATFFTTGTIAETHPRIVEDIVGLEHELGCHGHTHARFDKLSEDEAKREIVTATEILRKFYPVTSFRAPYLQFPSSYLKHLYEEGYKIDSSQGKHKNPFLKIKEEENILRIPVSTTSIVIRMNQTFRNIFLRRMKDPVVLFVHPWEYVDLRNEKLRLDCRFNTGLKALKALSQTIDFYKEKNARFVTMEDLQCMKKA